jgi:hypothetical protein
MNNETNENIEVVLNNFKKFIRDGDIINVLDEYYKLKKFGYSLKINNVSTINDLNKENNLLNINKISLKIKILNNIKLKKLTINEKYNIYIENANLNKDNVTNVQNYFDEEFYLIKESDIISKDDIYCSENRNDEIHMLFLANYLNSGLPY